MPTGAPMRPFSFGWELIAALILSMPVVCLIALAVDRVLFRPLRLRFASLVLFAMASLAASFFVRSAIYLVWGSDFLFYYPGRANPAIDFPLGIRVQADQLFVFGLAVVLVVITWFLLERTRIGQAHVLRREADETAGHVERILSRLQHPRQPVEPGLGIGVAQ